MANPINSQRGPVETIPPAKNHERAIQRVENLAGLMDSRFKLPLTNIRPGPDSLIGLVPVIGDTVSFGVSGYIIARSGTLGVPKRKPARMGANSAIDRLIGSIPLVGDVFDMGREANVKNAAILREHFET